MNTVLALFAVSLAALTPLSNGAIQEATEIDDKAAFSGVFLPNYVDSGRFNLIRMIGPIVPQQVQQQQQQQPFDYYDAVREEDHQPGRRTFVHEGQVQLIPSQRQGEIVIVDADTAYDDQSQAPQEDRRQLPMLAPQQPTALPTESTAQTEQQPRMIVDPEFPKANFHYPNLPRAKLVSKDVDMPAIVRPSAAVEVDGSSESESTTETSTTESTPEPVDEDDEKEEEVTSSSQSTTSANPTEKNDPSSTTESVSAVEGSTPEPVREEAEEDKPTASNEQSETEQLPLSSPDAPLEPASVESTTESTSSAATETSTRTSETVVEQSTEVSSTEETKTTATLKLQPEISSVESGEELKMPMVAGRGPRLTLME